MVCMCVSEWCVRACVHACMRVSESACVSVHVPRLHDATHVHTTHHHTPARGARTVARAIVRTDAVATIDAAVPRLAIALAPRTLTALVAPGRASHLRVGSGIKGGEIWC